MTINEGKTVNSPRGLGKWREGEVGERVRGGELFLQAIKEKILRFLMQMLTNAALRE